MIKTTFLVACIFALTMAVGSLGAEELPSIPLDREEALKAESAYNDNKEGYMAVLPRTLSSLIPLPFSHNPLYKNITVAD